MTKLSEKIKTAKERIKELELLIKHWQKQIDEKS
tara:strand:+ start:293 stop:394 length:102 start_codon:yes stop_codon:yes gene_type:complete